MLAYLFPGQGSQRPGMGKPLFDSSDLARRVFERARDQGSTDYADVCFGSSTRLLSTTQYAQPSIFVCSICAWETLAADGLRPDIVAGHSVGEMAALVSAGALSTGAALSALEQRGRLMQEADEGAMVTIIGLDPGHVDQLCVEARVQGPVVVGLVNGPENTVVSGAPGAVRSVQRAAVRTGALRVLSLPTDRAFHSPLMEPVVERWANHVSAMDIASPHTPIVLSTTGEATRDSRVIRKAMVDQFTHPVRWDRVVKTLAGTGVTVAVEVGESKALRSLVRMINPQIRTFSTLGKSSTAQLCASVRSELSGAAPPAPRDSAQDRRLEESTSHVV